MLNSDFNVFEVCISMVTAMMGLALPLFNERIAKIKEMYTSKRISDKIKSNFGNRLFNFLIVFCIIEMFTFPFVNAAVKSECLHHVLLTVQAISVFILSIDVIHMYHLFIVFMDPDSLLDRIKANEKGDELLQDLLVLIEYASTDEHHKNLYDRCMTVLMSHFNNYQESELKSEQ